MMNRLAFLCFLVACGGGASGDDDGDDGPDAGAPLERRGWVDVSEGRSVFDDGTGPTEYRTSQVLAAFFEDGEGSFHRETAASGDCVLRTYTPALCDQYCEGVCVGPNQCEPWPTRVSAGRLTVTGLETAVSIDPKAGWYYPQGALPENLFDDDATIEASLAGADLPAMSLDTRGVPEIEAAITEGKITITPGQDFVLRWTPAGVGRVRVTLNSNNQGHGQPYLGIIECDVEDSAGEVTIAHELHDAWPETQAWTVCAGTDCPPSVIRRYRRDAIPMGEQEIELQVANQLYFGVDHVFPD
jgi:hypothetical protein